MLASSRIQLLCALVHWDLSLGASSSVRSGVYLRLNNSAPSSASSSSTTRFCHTRRLKRWPNVSVELDVPTSAMAGQGGEGGGTRPSFGGHGTPGNSAGGVVGGSQRDSYPVSSWPNVSVELDVRTSVMAGQGGEGSGMRLSFGGPGTPANSAGGVVGGSQRDSYPVSSWPNVSVELDVRTSVRPSFGGPGTPANSSGGVVGGSQRDSYPVSRQQSGTSSLSAYRREGSNQFPTSRQQRGGRGNYNAGEGRPGHENEPGSSTGRGRRSMDPIEALGRCMTGILRHQAANYNLEMRNDGFVRVSDLLKQSKKTAAGFALSSYSEADVLKAVEVDCKKRFGMTEENGVLYIRAVQGHTIKTVESEHLLRSIAAPSEIPVCVHGTSEKAWKIIQEQGLKPMTRNHIHFATGLPKEDGVISGMRVTSEILIYLDVEKAFEDKMKLYISDNKVVLTEGMDGVILPKYFKDVRQADGTKLELKLPHDESVANIAAEPKADPRRTLIKKVPKNLDCVFRTSEKEMTTLWVEGLKVSKVSKDKFIHFAVPTVESSTRAAGEGVPYPVFIHLDVVKAFEAGMKLYLQDNEVVTEGTDGVISSDFFKRVYVQRPTSQISLFPPRAKPRNIATDA